MASLARLILLTTVFTSGAACTVVGPPIVLVPVQAPGPTPSVRDVFADLRSPTPGPSVPVPTAPPRTFYTGRALDVAIGGPGYLALSSRVDPRSWSDVTFTRDGALQLQFTPDASPLPGNTGVTGGAGTWSVRSRDGRYVLGYALRGDPDLNLPPEGYSGAFDAAFGGGVRGASVGALLLDANSSVSPQGRFDFRGRLFIGAQPPVDAAGEPRWLYLAVVQVETPSGLLGAPTGGFRYDFNAGLAQVGIAGVVAPRGDERPVGTMNALRPGYLEVL